jgi:hypothetical protein
VPGWQGPGREPAGGPATSAGPSRHEGGSSGVKIEAVWPLVLHLMDEGEGVGGRGDEGAARAREGGNGGGAEVEVVLSAGVAADVRLLVLEVSGGRHAIQEVLSLPLSLQPGRQALTLRLPRLGAGAAATTLGAQQAAVLLLLVMAEPGEGGRMLSAVDLLATSGLVAWELRLLGERMASECAVEAWPSQGNGLQTPGPPLGPVTMTPEVWATHYQPFVQDLVRLFQLVGGAAWARGETPVVSGSLAAPSGSSLAPATPGGEAAGRAAGAAAAAAAAAAGRPASAGGGGPGGSQPAGAGDSRGGPSALPALALLPFTSSQGG